MKQINTTEKGLETHIVQYLVNDTIFVLYFNNVC